MAKRLGKTVERVLLLVGVGLAPLALVVGIQRFSGWPTALPEVFVPSAHPEPVAELLGNLSLSLTSIAIASVVGAAVILREGAGRARRVLPVVLAFAILCGCVVAIYSGYRFQLALAEQLALYHLVMDRIVDRLETQALAVMFCTSCLLPLAVDTFVFEHTGHKAAPKTPRRQRSPGQA